MGLFFKSKEQEESHLKKWVVVFFHLFLPVVFGVWGIYLSVAANRNREQIDTLTKVVTELKEQNSRLQTLVTIQNTQLTAYLKEVKYNRRPFLKAELSSGNMNELADMVIKITNSGGDVLNLSLIPMNGTKIDAKGLSKNQTITGGADYLLHITNAKAGKIARLIYNDVLMNKFRQDLYWESGDMDNLRFSKMEEIEK